MIARIIELSARNQMFILHRAHSCRGARVSTPFFNTAA